MVIIPSYCPISRKSRKLHIPILDILKILDFLYILDPLVILYFLDYWDFCFLVFSGLSEMFSGFS